MADPMVTLTTDFGTASPYVAAMKGVILGINPSARILDLSHQIPPQNLAATAFFVAGALPHFPRDVLHLIVVDPGVGTARRPILLSTGRHYFVAPDNGVLSLIYSHAKRIQVRHIDAEHYYRQPVSSTFHARDVFAPVVAYLAKGVEPAKFGEEITDFVRFNAPKPKPVDAQTLRGVVLRVDRFGNIVTNFTPQDVPALFQANPPAFKIRVGKHEITEIHANYAEGAPNQVFGILGSMGYLEISANRAAAAQIIGAGKGSEVSILLEGASAATNSQ